MSKPILPRPYPAEKFKRWLPVNRPLANIPSVIVEGGKLQYPARSLLPQYLKISEMFPLRVGDTGPFRKWTENKLGFMSGQKKASKPIRTEIKRVWGKQPWFPKGPIAKAIFE